MMDWETHSITYSKRSMEIKRIQLRGISRSPSDRLTEDGGVAESLNAYLDYNENAPVVKPQDVTSDLGLPDNLVAERLFIHKTLFGEIVIIVDSSGVGYYKNQQLNTIFSFTQEKCRDIISIGNTLIVVTEKDTHYALYKGGDYVYMGTEIPMPRLRFETKHAYHYEADCYVTLALYNNDGEDSNHTHPAGSTPNAIESLSTIAWNQAIEDIKYGRATEGAAQLAEIQNKLWELINEKTIAIKQRKAFPYPILVRYALRLYDGSYIYPSVPIILGAGSEATMSHNVVKTISGSIVKSSIGITLDNTYTAMMYGSISGATEWSDIIKSVDVFASTVISYPSVNSSFERLGVIETTDGYSTYDLKFANDYSNIEEEIISKSLFFKVASFSPSQLSESSGYNLADSESLYSQDILVTQERLSEDSLSDVKIILSRVYSINNKLFAISSERQLSAGYFGLQSQNIKYKVTPDTDFERYLVRYTIRGGNGETFRVGHKAVFSNYMIASEVSRSYGLVFHPDPRCIKAEFNSNGRTYSVEMKPHPYINCAYGYWGISKQIVNLPYVDETDTQFLSRDNNIEQDEQRVYQTALNNPFRFSLSGTLAFSSKVLGLAIAHRPLSEGQFGQYPIYAFTEDGIWAMEQNEAGDIVSQKPLTGDCCINPNSIAQLDAGVVFVTKSGVMLLQGSQVTELSPYMNGKHYAIEPTAKGIVENQELFKVYADTLSDSSPFMSFAQNASIAYDYPGKRLIFINPSEDYQYVYKLDTQTWHKLYHPDFKLKQVLNSYPECFVVAAAESGSRIIDISTHLGTSEEQQTEKIILATRPFDLAEPDVFKTIRDVRVRGQFPRGAVKFILLGSNDGIHFSVISTLRGKSWKLFRLIILADLDATDRISWVDVGYETRFTNKLR